MPDRMPTKNEPTPRPGRVPRKAARRLALGLTLVLGLALPAAAQPVFTSPDFLNTNAASDSLSDFAPEIATDGAGNWVVVWHSRENLGGLAGTDYDIFVATSGDNGVTWSAPQVLNSSANFDTGSDTSPAIAVDSTGRWIAVWQSTESTAITPGAGTDPDIFFSMSTDDGLTWTGAELLNTNGTVDSGGDVAPQIANEGTGDWVVVWHSNESGIDSAGSDADIFFSRSPTASVTWASPSLLNTGGTTDSGFDHYPQIAYGAGTFVVAWHSNDNYGGTGADSDVWTQTSADGGQTWTPRYLLNDNGDADAGTDTYVQIAMDPSGTWVAVWNSTEDLGIVGTDYDIFTAVSLDGGASWLGPNVVNSNAIGDSEIDSNPRIVSSPQGGWVVTWYRQGGPSGTDGDIWGALSADQGLSWTAAALFNDNGLTDSGQDLPPAIASDGNGHWVAAWQSNENLNGTAGTDGDIFVASSDDIDGDGTPDTADAFALDPAESVDTDSDGIGNNADPDDDNDGLLDGVETNTGLYIDPNDTGTNPLNPDSDGDGLLDGLDLAPNDGGDCRSRNPQLEIVWGHPTPFGLVHQNEPGIGDRYLLDQDPALGLPGLSELSVPGAGEPGSLPDLLASKVGNLFRDARPLSLPATSNGIAVGYLLSSDPLPSLGTTGSPSLIFLVDRATIELTDPDFGPLRGFAWTGVNRFNATCFGGQATVIVDAIPAPSDPDYAAFVVDLIELIAHEAGHLYGLRHVLADGINACIGEVYLGTEAVMDYYPPEGPAATLAQCSPAPGQGCPVTEPPNCSGEETGDDHNPLYHFLHYVIGDSTDALGSVLITPGSWDIEGEPLVRWRVEFDFGCEAICNILPLYNISIVEVLPSGAQVVRKFYEELSIEQLNALTIELPESSGLMLYASTTNPETNGGQAPTNVVLQTPLTPPADPAAPVVIISTLLEVEETSPGVYQTTTLAEDSNVSATPVYEVRATGTYDVSDPNVPDGAFVSTSTYIPPLAVTGAPAGVPEPGFGMALASGLAGLLSAHRWRTRRRPK